MEDPTQFDLNEAIHRWRDRLAASPAIHDGNLDELESHLRDSAAALEANSLSTEEAFLIARHRLGSADSLEREFGKVNTRHLWLDRAVWMVVGSLSISAVGTMVWVLSNLVTVLAGLLSLRGHALGVLNIACHLGGLIGALVVLWRFITRKPGTAWRLGVWMRHQPISTAAIVGLLLLAGNLATNGASFLAARILSLPTYQSIIEWRIVAGLVPLVVLPALLAWLLRRRTRAEVAG